MAQKASELLEKESSTILADTGYYNGTEIKNCVDAGMNVFIKKLKRIMLQRIMNFAKKRLYIMVKLMNIQAQQEIDYDFLKIHRRMV